MQKFFGFVSSCELGDLGKSGKLAEVVLVAVDIFKAKKRSLEGFEDLIIDVVLPLMVEKSASHHLICLKISHCK